MFFSGMINGQPLINISVEQAIKSLFRDNIYCGFKVRQDIRGDVYMDDIPLKTYMPFVRLKGVILQ